jgi:uncharacterized SAM-binding protein YcdF (DUF218 family)
MSCERKPAALVLGAAVWSGGRASPTLVRRAERAAALWHAGQTGAFVCCGGIGRHPPSEAEVIARLLHAAGVPSRALHLEPASTSTETNITFALPILRELRASDIWIVTDWWHAPRAVLLARAAGLRAQGAPVSRAGGSARFQARMVLRESGAIVGTGVRLAWRALRRR